MARDITAAPPILPPRLNPDPLLKDIQFDKRHIGPPLPLPRKRKLVARSARMARMLPSCAQLPSIWNKDMDRFVCECDALGEFNVKIIIRLLKKKWPFELGSAVVTPEAVERRVYCMDQSLNDYFRKGMLTAVNRLEQKGIFLPPPDFGLEGSHSKDSIEASMLHPARHWGRASTDFSSGERPISHGGLRLVADVEEETEPEKDGDRVNVLTSRAYIPPEPQGEGTARQRIVTQTKAAGNENDGTRRSNSLDTLPLSKPSGLLSRRDASNTARGANTSSTLLGTIYSDGPSHNDHGSFPRSTSGQSRLVDRVQPIRTDSKRSKVSAVEASSKKETQMV